MGLIQSESVQAENFNAYHSFKLGLEAGYYNNQDSNSIKNDGGIVGTFGEYKLHFSDSQILPDTLLIDANIKAGKVDSSLGGEFEDQKQLIAEIRANLGKEFNFSNSIFVTPYAGIGYRYQNTDPDEDDLLTTSGHYLQERESHYLYIPIGIKTTLIFLSDWSIGFTTEFDVFLTGTQESHFNNIEEDLTDGYGFRGSVAFTKKTAGLDLLIEPYARWWDIDNEENSMTAAACPPFCDTERESDNETYEVGLRIGFSL